MKKVIVLSLLTLSSLASFSEEHFKFLGIEIDGTKEDFTQKLKEKGFTFRHEESDQFITYAGLYENRPVELHFSVTPHSQTVQFVAVSFSKSPSWDSVKSLYEELRSVYAQQLPLEREVKYFEAPYREGDGKEMEALKRRKCLYLSNFKNDQGSILLMVTEFQQIVVAYQDTANTALGKEEEFISENTPE